MQTRSQKNGQAEQREISVSEKLNLLDERRREVKGYGSFVDNLLYINSYIAKKVKTEFYETLIKNQW